MRSVWKHPFGPTGSVSVACTPDAKPVHVGLDPEKASCIWIEDERDSGPPRTMRHFTIVGTGHSILPDAEHVGSFTEQQFVWHVYEIKS